MNTLTSLKRSTAVAALAAMSLTMAPIAASAQSQSQGTQGQQAQSQTSSGTQNSRDLVPSDKEIKTYKSQEPTAAQGTRVIKKDGEYSEVAAGQTEAGAERSPANETGIVTEGKEGTQSGEAPDMAPTDDQTGLAKSAQQTQTDQQSSGQQSSGQQSQAGQQSQSGQSAQGGQQGATSGHQAGAQGKAGAGQDVLVAKVGDREIRQSDVMTVIGMLPPQLQQQPPEMLVPIALDQLVMRELILQKAKDAGLENDPDVKSLADDASQRGKEDAMVQVWLDRELGNAVTDQKVKETYDTVKEQLGAQAPSMEQLRPQIEQELRQQAFLDLSRDLQEDAEITLYGPDGQPITQ